MQRLLSGFAGRPLELSQFLPGDVASVKLKVDGEVAQVKKGTQTFPLSRVVWHNCLVELTVVGASEDLESAAPADKKQSMLAVAQAGGHAAADQTSTLLDAMAAAKKKLDEIQKATLHEQGRAKTCVGYAYKYDVEEYEKKRPVTSAEQEKMVLRAKQELLRRPGRGSVVMPAELRGGGNARRKGSNSRSSSSNSSSSSSSSRASAAKAGSAGAVEVAPPSLGITITAEEPTPPPKSDWSSVFPNFLVWATLVFIIQN